MPIKSRFSEAVPDVSLPTWLFGPPEAATQSSLPVYYGAENPAKEHLTFGEYKLWSQRLASGLRKHGVKGNDRVLLFSPNNIFFPVVVMGVIMSGATFTGANPSYSVRELTHQLKDAGATTLITSPEGLETAKAAAQATGLPADQVIVFETHRGLDGDEAHKTQQEVCRTKFGHAHWTSLLRPAEEAKSFAWDDPKTRDACTSTIAALNYSSGTTGLSKGVKISHRNYVANAVQMINMEQQDPEEPTKRDRCRLLACLPMYHAMGQCVFVTMAPRRGIPTYIMRKFSLGGYLEAIQRFKITQLDMVPPIAVQIAKKPEVKNYDLSSVEVIVSGAAPLSREVCGELEALWPRDKIVIKQGWGMTECTCGILGFNPAEKPVQGSVGELTANCEGMIMSEDGTKELGRNEAGEIWVRSPNIMAGYWRNDEATKNTVTPEGWLKTGDIGYCDDNGKWFIVDRIKELIKVKGHQVAPAELEGLLLELPEVQDAAVIGLLRNEEEHPRAYVVPNGFQPNDSLQGVVDMINEKLVPYKRITGGVVGMEAIPKSPSGKILRRELRERAKREVTEVRARL